MGKTDESSDCYQRALTLLEKEQKSKSKMEKVHDEESDGYDMPYHVKLAMSSSKKYKSMSDLHHARSIKNGRLDNQKPKIGLSRSKTLSKIKNEK
uniref:Uncharacterized protein n=1 Tax=Ditylenchus dipsaci TaxID=166011 RepID=A0A915ERN3_9BILA